MSRARNVALGTLGAAAWAAAGVAAAGHRGQTTQQAAATFGAGAVSHDKTTTCVAGDGTYQYTDATYTGTANLSGTTAIPKAQLSTLDVVTDSGRLLVRIDVN